MISKNSVHSMTEHGLDILVQSPLWDDALKDAENFISPIIQTALRHIEDVSPGELSIVLADDAFIQDLNKTWRGKDKPTNVLSFPQNEPGMLGDVIIAYETVAREAADQDKSFEHHFTHLLVHGVLHLLGHDHENDDDAETMEALEIAILEVLGVKNPYKMADTVP